MRIFWIIFCTLATISLYSQPAGRINPQRDIQQATHNGKPIRFGGNPVAGSYLMTDSIGRLNYVKDSLAYSGDTIFIIKKDIVTGAVFGIDTTLLTGVGIQSLAKTNDSLEIVGGNKVRRDVVTVDDISEINGNFPVGTIIQTRGFTTPGDGAGATYKVSGSSIWTPDDTTVFLRNSKYIELQPINNSYDIRWFGAKTSGDAYYPLQKAINYAYGENKVKIPAGNFSYSQTLTFGNRGINLEGVGSHDADVIQSILTYTGTDDAISVGAGFTSGESKIRFANFALKGNASAIHGFDLDFVTHGGLVQNDHIENVRIENFTNSGSYAIYATRTYTLVADMLYIENCDGGIYLGQETVRAQIKDSWIRNIANHAIHSTYSGQPTVSGGVIDHTGTPAVTQRGVYMAAGSVMNLDNIHFEGNYMHVEAVSGARAFITQCRWNSQDVNSVFANGAKIKMIGNFLPDNVGVTVGLGTEWIGDLQGNHLIPTITANNPVGFATYNYVDGSSGAFLLEDYSVPGLPDGEFTLEFLDDSVTLNHATSGSLGSRIVLAGNMPFKGHMGDKITLIKRENSAGTAYIVETGRQRASNIIEVQARTYALSKGESGLTFNNNFATDTVEFVLPGSSLQDDEPVFTFVKEVSQVILISTNTGRGIIGGSVSGSTIELQSGSVTLQLDSLYYRPIAHTGNYVHKGSGLASGYDRGVFSGVPWGVIEDTLNIPTYAIGDRLTYTVAGNKALGNVSQLTYNGTAAANSRRIDLNSDNFARVQLGVGLETPSTSNRAHIAGIGDLTFPTANALSILGYRHGGTYASKTDLTNATAALIGITAYGWRNNAVRSAAGISFSGANVMSTNGYSGVIGFAVSDGTTYSRRMTLHRNGDLYLGLGLGTVEPDATTSKLLIRGDGTTTGNLFLAEDSGGTDRFSIKDNGETIVGSNDNGTYSFQVDGTSYFHDNVTINANAIIDAGDLYWSSSELLIGGGSDEGNYKLQVAGSTYLSGYVTHENGAYDLYGTQSYYNTSVPSSVPDGASVWARDVTAGQSELFARGETGNAEQITGLTRILNADANSTSTSYAAISDLTFNVEAGKKYVIRGFVRTTSIPLGGIKVNLDGSSTVTSLLLYFNENRATPTTALGTAIFSTATTETDRAIELFGTVVVDTAGTLGLQFGQVDADGGTTTIGAGSYLELKPTTN